MAIRSERERQSPTVISTENPSGLLRLVKMIFTPTARKSATVLPKKPSDISVSDSNRNIDGDKNDKPTDELTPDLLEWWSNLPRRIESYNETGKILWIGQEGKEEQVMDTFERPWVEETVKQMWYGKRGPQEVAERGFGLGLMSDQIHEKMKAYQRTEARGKQRHVIIELNKQVYDDAKKWAEQKQKEGIAEGRTVNLSFINIQGTEERRDVLKGGQSNLIEIIVINGDADKALEQFPDNSFDLIFSDTHQLKPEHLGIHDILKPKNLIRKLKWNGSLTFLAWHRKNQTGKISQEQLSRIQDDFAEIRLISRAKVLVHSRCQYLEPGEKTLPVIICKYPILKAA